MKEKMGGRLSLGAVANGKCRIYKAYAIFIINHDLHLQI